MSASLFQARLRRASGPRPSRKQSRSTRSAIASRARPRPCSSTSAGSSSPRSPSCATSSARRASSTASSRTRWSRWRSRTRKLDTDEFKKHLTGETGIAWSYEDPSIAAKVVKEFRKDDVTRRSSTIKCGVLEDQVMPASAVETELATMPGKDEVRAMLLAQLMAPAQKLVMQLTAPARTSPSCSTRASGSSKNTK